MDVTGLTCQSFWNSTSITDFIQKLCCGAANQSTDATQETILEDKWMIGEEGDVCV